MEDLQHKAKNVWTQLSQQEKQDIFAFAKEYMDFLDKSKTEREAVTYIVELLDNNGFVKMQDLPANPAAGTKFYTVNRKKSLIAGVIGSEDITQGCNAIGAHIDSPRLDFKPSPLYEDNSFAYAKTHYYGGIKKYQWLTIPLALHGVVVLNDGNTVELKIGEDESDPVFVITDLLPHLSQEQLKKTADTFVPAEQLNVLIGSIPFEGTQEEKDAVKINILNILNSTYGLKEKDFYKAEIEIVPAFKARDIGFDKGLIGSYGHDDRVCSYAALKALLDIKDIPAKTALCYFSDKEEIGSVGNTGARGNYFMLFMMELCSLFNFADSSLAASRAIFKSRFLSADVTAAFDPNFSDVYDKYNVAYINKGIAIEKYTGARGKSGASDANAEFVSEILNVLDENNVPWQLTEMGKVDVGGGGTIAQYMTDIGFNVIDCGVPVMSMHSPYETVSKCDLYMTYKAYKCLLR